jgi:hypothetical protein
MKQKLTKTAALLFLLFFKTCRLQAQETKNPFKVNLSEDGKNILNLVRIFNYGKVYKLNPNRDNVVSQSTDIVVRRLRVQAMGMLTDKVFHIQFGQNNINFTQIQVHQTRHYLF